jgi:hypothetical protein
MTTEMQVQLHIVKTDSGDRRRFVQKSFDGMQISDSLEWNKNNTGDWNASGFCSCSPATTRLQNDSRTFRHPKPALDAAADYR